MVSHDSEAGRLWHAKINSVTENRCVVCQGCYDAPCQLNLSSPEGIDRGASKVKVYNGARLSVADPTRLFLEAGDTDEWRDVAQTAAGFFPVAGSRTLEEFLNDDSLKEQLMSRYIYEHWFLAHLYFETLPDREFFTLVRSRKSLEPVSKCVLCTIAALRSVSTCFKAEWGIFLEWRGRFPERYRPVYATPGSPAPTRGA